MKNPTLTLLLLFTLANLAFSQPGQPARHNPTIITPLEKGTFEIREFTVDSLLIYKGVLSSVNPDTRHGRFYFYHGSGDLAATGLYNQDIPYGNWEYYDEIGELIRQVDYTAVWDYLDNDALDYAADSAVLQRLKRRDKKNMLPDGTFFQTQVMPSFNGGDPNIAFQEYIRQNAIYPVYASRKSIVGGLTIQFVIDTLGRIRNPIIEVPEIPDFNIEAMRLLTEAPPWDPGQQSGFPVNVLYRWTFTFNSYSANVLVPSLPRPVNDTLYMDGKELVFYIVEEMPLFNGGEPAIEFRKYIASNLEYPEAAAENKISGRVIVQFAVNSEGYVTESVVVRSAHPLLDQEALRVVNASPRWTPGQQRGKAVKVLFTFPINFTLGKSGAAYLPLKYKLVPIEGN